MGDVARGAIILERRVIGSNTYTLICLLDHVQSLLFFLCVSSLTLLQSVLPHSSTRGVFLVAEALPQVHKYLVHFFACLLSVSLVTMYTAWGSMFWSQHYAWDQASHIKGAVIRHLLARWLRCIPGSISALFKPSNVPFASEMGSGLVETVRLFVKWSVPAFVPLPTPSHICPLLKLSRMFFSFSNAPCIFFPLERF